LGDHIRKKRLELGLFQRDAAEQIGVDPTTIWNWESHKSSPQVHDRPRIIEFLGYDPSPEPSTLAEKLLAARTDNGLTQKEMAKRLGVDPTTLSRLERGRVPRPTSQTLCKIRSLLKM